MIDPTSRAILQNLIRRESRSLLQYVSEAFPWTTRAEQDALARLQQLVKEELDGARSVARFLVKHHIVPDLSGPYPMSFTTINFVTLDHLLPLLIELQHRRIADLESDLSRMPEGEARAQVERHLNLKRQHLTVLEDMLKNLGHKTAAAVS